MKRGPGKWQRMILERLVTSNGFLLVDLMRAELGFKLTPLKRKAAHHAARDLEKKGQCRIELETHRDRRERQQKQVVICRPGSGRVANVDAAPVIEGEPEKISASAAHAPRTDNLTKLACRSSLGGEDEDDASPMDRYVYAEWLAGTREDDEVPGSPEYLRSHDLTPEQYEAIRAAEQAEYDAKMAADDGALCPHCDGWLLITEVASGEHERLCECCQINWADPAQVAAYEDRLAAERELRNPVLEPVLHDYDDLQPATKL